MANRSERLARAALEHHSTVPLFNTKAVVKQTGVPAPTLRAWERRYGILAPYRGENDYRLYSERDIAIVRWLREEVESGLTISQAIALLRTVLSPPAAPQGQAAQRATSAPPWAEAPSSLTASASSAPASQPASAPGQPPLLATLGNDLLTALMQLDESLAHHLLGQAFACMPLEQVITDLIEPLLWRIGEQWAAGHLSVTTEHFATSVLRAQLEALYRAEHLPASGPLVLVGCAPGEYHELGALVLALLLRRHYPSLRTLYLGQNVEPVHLIETVQTLRPAAVCLSAALLERQSNLVDVAQRFLALPAAHRPALICGGQGLQAKPLPKEVPALTLTQRALEALPHIAQLCLPGQPLSEETTS